MDELKAMGIELMVSVWPQIDRYSENFEGNAAKGLFDLKLKWGSPGCDDGLVPFQYLF